MSRLHPHSTNDYMLRFRLKAQFLYILNSSDLQDWLQLADRPAENFQHFFDILPASISAEYKHTNCIIHHKQSNEYRLYTVCSQNATWDTWNTSKKL